MGNLEKLKIILKESNGVLLTSQLKEHGISRGNIKKLLDLNIIEKVSRGIYASTDILQDEFYCLQQRYKRGVFSHNTALYFHGLTDKTPLKIDITFPSVYREMNNDKIKKHYIKVDKFTQGIIKFKSLKGNEIYIYNMERTICDIIRDRNKLDVDILTKALNEYVKRPDKDLNTLNKYAICFRVKNTLNKYLEVIL